MYQIGRIEFYFVKAQEKNAAVPTVMREIKMKLEVAKTHPVESGQKGKMVQGRKER